MDGFFTSRRLNFGITVAFVDAGLLAGGKGDNQGRQTCFCTAVTPLCEFDVDQSCESGKPRMVPYRNEMETTPQRSLFVRSDNCARELARMVADDVERHHTQRLLSQKGSTRRTRSCTTKKKKLEPQVVLKVTLRPKFARHVSAHSSDTTESNTFQSVGEVQENSLQTSNLSSRRPVVNVVKLAPRVDERFQGGSVLCSYSESLTVKVQLHSSSSSEKKKSASCQQCRAQVQKCRP